MRISRLCGVLWLASAVVACTAATGHMESYSSGGRIVQYESFSQAGSSHGPLLILLPGTGGPEVPFYRSQAEFFASKGYTTLMLHYFDAASSRSPDDKNYEAWSAAVRDLVTLCAQRPEWKSRDVFVMGYSLGASIALAAGSEDLPVQAIAEWYGSLPDSFFLAMKGMPPLLILHGARDDNIPVMNAQQLIRLCGLKKLDCASHIYPDEPHGFSPSSNAEADARTLAFFGAHASGGTKQAANP